jgi:hypothetical protein
MNAGNQAPVPVPLVPEPFVWKVVESLVTACQVVHSGRAGTVPGAAARWQPITHLDMHMSNIFIQPPVQAGEAGEVSITM